MTSRLPKYIQNILDQEGVFKKEEEPVDKGLALHAAGDFDGALPLLQPALAGATCPVPVIVAVASIFHGRGDDFNQIATLRRGLAVHPRSHELFVLLGEAYQERQEFESAEEAYRKALKLCETYTDGFVKLGIMLFETERKEEAEQVFDRALSLDRGAIMARHFLALICMDRQDWRRATTQIHWIKQLDPAHSSARLLQATIFERQGDSLSALGELEQLVEKKIADADVYWRIGKLNLSLKNRMEGLAAFQKTAELKPDKWEAHFYVARLQESLDNRDEALKAYLKVIEHNPAMWDCYMYAARLFEGAKKWEQAIAHYQAILEVEKWQEEATEGHQRLSTLLVDIAATMAGTPQEPESEN